MTVAGIYYATRVAFVSLTQASHQEGKGIEEDTEARGFVAQ